MPVPVIDEIELIHGGRDGGIRPPAGGDDDGGGGQNFGGHAPIPQRAFFTAIQLALAGILMFFMALTSSFLVRKGLGNDWVGFTLPRVLWFNTLVLLASSGTVHIAVRRLREGALEAFHHWWALTTALGLIFIAGQLLVWRQLAAEGVYLASNPSSSFFYVLTALHGLHLFGGVVALVVVRARSWRTSRITQSSAASIAALYWHFMDGLWLFLLALLYLGR